MPRVVDPRGGVGCRWTRRADVCPLVWATGESSQDPPTYETANERE